MPDKKITDLVDGGDPQPTDDFVVARAGDNFKVAWSSMAAAATEGNLAATLSGNTAGALAGISSGTLTLAGGNNITLSQAGNAVTISGANVGGAQTAISGISASDTLYTSGTVRLTGSQAVTVRSGTGQLVIIDAPAQSVQPETQTFIAGVSASDTLYTSGNVRLTGVGGGITVSSNTGQRVDLSVAAQSVQSQNMVAVTLSGNTSGAQALISSGTLTLAGGNNITVSQAGNAVTISGPNVGGAQTGISGIANSQTTYTSGTVSLSELGAITIRSTTGNQFQLSVNAQSVQPETQTFIAGISASDTLYTSGNVRITGVGGGVTVSSNTGQRVDISVAAQSVQPETQTFLGGIQNSQTTYTSGTVNLSVVAGNLTIRSTTGQAFQFSMSQTVQPETQTAISGIANSQTTYTSGTVSLSELGAVTIRSTTGNQFQISVNAQSAQTGISGIANSQTTYTSGTVSLSELGAITIRSTTGNQYQLSVNSQTVQTQGILSAGVSTGGNTVGNTTVNTGSRFVLVASGNATASQATAAGASTVTISVGTQTVQTQGVLSAGVSNVGNTSGNTTVNTGSRLVLAGGNNITLSQGTAAGATTITISAPNLGAGAFSGGASNLGNTAGATGITGTQMVFVGSDNITLSQTTGANGGTLSIIGGGGGGFSAGVSTGGNTAGSTGVTGTRLVFVGNSPLSLSQSTAAAGGTVSFNAPATSSLSATGAVEISTNGSTISIGAPNIRKLDDFQNFPMGLATLMTHAASISKTPFYFPIMLAGKMTANSFVIRLSAVTTNTLQSFSIHAGFYTLVNSTSMALLGSWSESYVQSTASSASWSGVRNYVMTGIGTHTALSNLNGGDYVIGLMFSAGAAGSMAQSILGAGTGGGPLGRIVPGVNQQSTGTSQGAMPLNGRGSTTVNALPANVVASELINQGTGASMQLHPWIYIRS